MSVPQWFQPHSLWLKRFKSQSKSTQDARAGPLWERGLQNLPECQAFIFPHLVGRCFAAAPRHINLTGIYVEALCVQTVFLQDLSAAVTWHGPEVDPSSQCTQPGAFVYILALATNRVLSEASWESCVPFIVAERNPRWQIPPLFNYRNSKQTHGKRLNWAEKRASLNHFSPLPSGWSFSPRI